MLGLPIDFGGFNPSMTGFATDGTVYAAYMNSAAEPITQPHGGGQAKPSRPVLSAVLITMGTRPEELKRSINSILNQAEPPSEIILVGNGVEVPGLPSEVTQILAENIGIPAGRNRGSMRLAAMSSSSSTMMAGLPMTMYSVTSATSSPPSRISGSFRSRSRTLTVVRASADTFRDCARETRSGPSTSPPSSAPAYALRKEVLEQWAGFPTCSSMVTRRRTLPGALDHGWRIR